MSLFVCSFVYCCRSGSRSEPCVSPGVDVGHACSGVLPALHPSSRANDHRTYSGTSTTSPSSPSMLVPSRADRRLLLSARVAPLSLSAYRSPKAAPAGTENAPPHSHAWHGGLPHTHGMAGFHTRMAWRASTHAWHGGLPHTHGGLPRRYGWLCRGALASANPQSHHLRAPR